MSAIGGSSAGPALHHQLGDTDEPNNGNAWVKKRTNVLLLGDRLGDLGMSDGLNYENQIAVGFLIHLSSITSIICLLLKPDKFVHITKSFPSLGFVASLPAVFTSTHVGSHKESRFLIRHHLSPKFSSDDGDEGKTSVGVSDALHLPSSSADTQERCDIKSSMEEFNIEAFEAS